MHGQFLVLPISPTWRFARWTVQVGRNTLNHTNAIEISYLCSTDFGPASALSPLDIVIYFARSRWLAYGVNTGI
jgi:hypothetical protein